MANLELTPRQIRAKIYYLKKTGQTGKYKRYLRQYRDYNSEDEEELISPIGEGIYSPNQHEPNKDEDKQEIDEEADGYILLEEVYNNTLDKIKKHYTNSEVNFLQSFFNKTNKKGIQTLWDFFRDRQTIINDDI